MQGRIRAAHVQGLVSSKDALIVTRELKLALIVGFALVLGVTVLISDHLSKARKSELESGIVQQPELTPAPVPDPVPQSTLVANPAPSGLGLGGSITSDPSPAGATVEPPAPVTLVMGQGGGVSTPSGHEALAQLIRERGGEIQNGEIRLPPAAGLNQPGGPGDAPVQIDPRMIPPVGRSASEPPKPEPKTGREYIVVAGDSAYKIAKQFYGRGEDWRRLSDANPGRIGPKGEVRTGVRLTVPGVSSADGARPAGKPDAKPSAGGARTYTVKKGDTLGLIAQRELKTVKRSAEILKLNPKITDPDNIPLGFVLQLPDR